MRKPYTRWTWDTETAFLLALRSTGTVRAAAAAIGRCETSAYKRRQRDPGFAARWDAAIREWQAEWIAREGEPPERSAPRERWDGWSQVRQRAFLRALAETGEVRAASARAGVTHSAVYRLKARSPAFARACAQALERSLPVIEQVAWERAVEGWDEEIVSGGKVVGTRRRYSETLLRTLLTQELAARRSERAAVARLRPVREVATREETDAALREFIDRTAKMQRAKLLAEAERWERMQIAVGGGDGDGWVRG